MATSLFTPLLHLLTYKLPILPLHWCMGSDKFTPFFSFVGPLLDCPLHLVYGFHFRFVQSATKFQVSLSFSFFLVSNGGPQSLIKLGKGQTLSTGHVVTKMVVTWSAALTRRWLTGPAMAFSDLVSVETESLFCVINNFYV